MSRSDPTVCPALLAVELAQPAPAHALRLPTEQAAALVDAVASDLARLVPGVEGAGLALAGALYDPAQALRPGWPLHRELVLHYRGEPRTRSAPQVMAFGTAGGRMASAPLEPEPGFEGGLLRVAPFVLVADAALAQALGDTMERDFESRGLAGAAVDLFLRQALGLEVVHARYLTHHDLCALTALQLDHAGYGAIWQLIEAALFAPATAESATLPTGQTLHLADGVVRVAPSGYSDWVAGPGAQLDPAQRAQAYADWWLAQRQAVALLRAHGLVVRWELPVRATSTLDASGTVLLEALDAAAGNGLLRAHTAPELGTLAISAVVDGQARAHAYPLEPDAGPAAVVALSRWVESGSGVSGQGPLGIGPDGRALGVPSGRNNAAQAPS
jgi:hypothetical protein